MKPEVKKRMSLLAPKEKDKVVCDYNQIDIIFEDLLFDIVLEVIYEQDKDQKRHSLPCGICDKYECPLCGGSYPANRFAPHLEKCMGMGRASSRAARTKVQEYL